MVKIFFQFVLLIMITSCRSPSKLTNYLEGTHPGSAPTIFAPNIVSIKGRLEHGISFSPDGKELAFGLLNKVDFSGKVFYSKRVNKNWTEPIVFQTLKDESVFLPYFSPDGRSMLFTKSSANANNYLTDVWVINKNNDIWNGPKKMEAPISSLTREATACMTLDNTIYFSSNRNGNGLADIYVSRLDNGDYSNVERIDAVSTERDEESVFISSDESYMIFSRYVTDDNPPDLFISYRDAKKNWSNPELLDTTINTADWERRPFVTIDNKRLFFTKLIVNQDVVTESDIYWVNTQKVFKPFVFNPIGSIMLKLGEETEFKIPTDYFKDIDNKKLEVILNNENIQWAKLEANKMTLVMNPNEVGTFDLIFTAVDDFSNKTYDRVKVIVEK